MANALQNSMKRDQREYMRENGLPDDEFYSGTAYATYGAYSIVPHTIMAMVRENAHVTSEDGLVFNSDAAYLWIYLTRFVNTDPDNKDFGFSWPSYDKIRNDTGWSKDKISKYQKVLVKYNLLKIEKRRIPGGGARNFYSVVYPTRILKF